MSTNLEKLSEITYPKEKTDIQKLDDIGKESKWNVTTRVRYYAVLVDGGTGIVEGKINASYVDAGLNMYEISRDRTTYEDIVEESKIIEAI